VLKASPSQVLKTSKDGDSKPLWIPLLLNCSNGGKVFPSVILAILSFQLVWFLPCSFPQAIYPDPVTRDHVSSTQLQGQAANEEHVMSPAPSTAALLTPFTWKVQTAL